MHIVASLRQALVEPAVGADLKPLVGDIDCLQIPVPDLENGLAFYRDALGQPLLWRTRTAAGLQLADSRAELVVQTERSELEANLSVASADSAAQRFVEAGGAVLVPPFEIAIGRCAVVQDPWGNRLVLLDHRKGRLVANADGSVMGTSAGDSSSVGAWAGSRRGRATGNVPERVRR
ncbi:MAG: VOC family protein [Chloroflexi bacterium]|nr:VOC family protein [Chloroflexota bacterium]MBV9596396.1 VOC family protein [Chloroflexota bacterium]